MRRLMWFSLGFSAACAVGAYWYTPWLIAFAAVALLFFVGVLLVRRDWKLWRPMAAMSLGVSLGLCWFCIYQTVYISSAAQLDSKVSNVVSEATEYSVSTDHGCSVQSKMKLDGRTYRITLYLNEDIPIKPGDQIDGQFRLRLTHEGLDGNTYHRGNGTFLLGYATEKTTVAPCEQIPVRYYPAVLREDITNRLDELFPEDTAFFTKALLLGDRSGVDYETNTAFKTSGISHIIAISGLHISILFSVIYMLLGKRRLLTAFVGIPLLLFFAAAAGFTPSVTRACIMQILMIVAMLVNREYDPSTALAAAVLIMLSVNPLVVTSPSFQLSVGCMGGIFLFSERIKAWIVNLRFWRNWKGKSLRVRMRQWFAGGVSVTLSSMFFTTPLVAYYFGCVSLVGIITNLLTLWVVSWIFYGILLVCLISLFWHQGAAILAWFVSWLIRYVIAVAKWIASFPLAAVYTKSIYIVMWLVLCYLLIGIFLLSRKRKTGVLLCCGFFGLCMALFCSWVEPMLSNSRMVMFDVGQGQSILLQSHGKTYLVDCGGDSDTASADLAAETLLSMGIYRLDGIILTHYDDDHAAGVDKLLSRIPADAVFLPRYTENVEMRRGILNASQGHCVYVDEDVLLSWEGTSIQVFAPLSGLSENESGLCILFTADNCDILITGDIGIDGENRLVLEKNLPDLTALVAGHHGSKYSTGSLLLSKTNPEYAFISVGEDNSYGHPSPEVLQRLEEQGCEIRRTDRDGTIIFRG